MKSNMLNQHHHKSAIRSLFPAKTQVQVSAAVEAQDEGSMV